MAEQFLWRLLLIVLTTFASPTAFMASFYLLSQEMNSLLNGNEVIAEIGLDALLFGVSKLPLTFVALLQGINRWVALCILLLIVLLAIYVTWVSKRGIAFLESRRLHKSMAAMEIIYAFILLFAGFQLFSHSFTANISITVIVFVISMVGMFKFKNKIPLIVYCLLGCLITYFLL